MAKLIFDGFINRNGTKYSSNAIPEEMKFKLAKCIIENESLKQLSNKIIKKP